MKNFYILLAFVFLATGCASQSKKPDFAEDASGFLVNYDLLEPVPGASGMEIYAYKNEDVNRDDYYAAIVEPVFIYEDAIDEEDDDVTEADIENAKRGITNGLRKMVAEHYQLTDKAGPGVFRMQVAITGADLEGEGLKPWNIIPVSAAIRLSTYATGYDNKKPILMVEMKITDSQSGEILKEILTISNGDYFRSENKTAEEFESLSKQWVKFVVDYSDVFTVEE